ncbi:MAG TPA: hypothetical protein VIK78_19525, partial [Ruminiclostridium sp.]
MKYLGKCKVCGLPITDRHCVTYCSRVCYNQEKNAKTIIVQCEFCNADIKQVGSDVRRFCSVKCSSDSRVDKNINGARNKKATGINRPYTSDTRHLIRLWYKQGDKKTDIALILGRSLASV